MEIKRINIRNIADNTLSDFLKEHKEQVFRSKQIRQWIWQKGVTDFEEMNNLSKPLRTLLAEHFYFDKLTLSQQQTASDGTTKTAWSLLDGNMIESVLIPSQDRFTVCVSSQAGCQLGCKFCATGTLGFKRNLTPGEIFEQVVYAQREAETRGGSLSNIVFMGMGEPLLNYENVLQAIGHITSTKGLDMSPYRITLSTAGIADKIKSLADDNVRFNLAVSLHAADNEIRSSLMPVNNKYALETLAESLKYFVKKTGSRPTFEYLLINGVNDSLENAAKLAQYCKQFPIKINIIEYNDTDHSPFRSSPEKQRDAFVQFLESKNMIVNVRRSKGKEIDAACGQLVNKSKLSN